ncbi:MAG: hypothetical protein H0X62_04105, partial [Bacteroidetes bacterium]|nr:hypothetical protein [Bacteroidota bacterium]
MNMESRKLELNKPQLRLAVNLPKVKETVSIWSRATGKSFDIAWLLRMIVETMPRSSGGIVGQTYKQILTRTLPSTLSGLEYLGYKKDVHYVIKRKPPPKLRFDTPIEGPIDHDHYMSFKNGTGAHLVSLDSGGGSSRGLNLDWIITDETLLINKERFDKDVSSTNRGKRKIFGKLPYHHGVFHFTSMPYGDQAKWILDKGKYYKEDGHDYRAIRNEIVKKQLQFIDNKDVEYRLRTWQQINQLKSELKFYRSKNGTFYNEADIFDNISNVGISFIEQQRRDLTDFIFLVEILNWLPEVIENGFYPALTRVQHGYTNSGNNSYLTSLDIGDERLKSIDSRMDEDCIPNLPLRIAVDWGSKLNCLTAAQHFQSINTLKYLKNIYVKHPKILDDLAKAFIDYYYFHPNKTVYFAYDHTGNTKMANSNLTYAEQFAKILTAAGWTVIMVSKG